MIRRQPFVIALTWVLLIASASTVANAQGFCQLLFFVDYDGYGWIENGGSTPFDFDGYSIHSPEGKLDPLAVTTVASRASTPGFPESLGMTSYEAMMWNTQVATPNDFVEQTTCPYYNATLSPGTCLPSMSAPS